MKKKLTVQIAGAVLAVIFTAGLGTAALASAEPPSGAQPPQQQQQTVPAPAPQGAQPQRPDGIPAAPASTAPNGEPSGEAPTLPTDEPSQEPGASGEMAGEPADRNSASGERTAAPDRTEAPADEGGTLRQLRVLLDDILQRFLSLFGGRQEALPAQDSGAPAISPALVDNGQQPSGEMGGSGEPADYTAASTVTEDSTGGTYSSATGGENAVLVSGSTVTLRDVTVTKTGSSSGDSADFYGVNAGVLAKDGASLTIENADITTDGAHANGVFSYGAGTTVNISDSTITTSANNSGGIMTTGGATLNAANLTVSTSGGSSAAIRSDRGGGTVNVTEGSYSASGVGSPAIYSTADIHVSDAVLTATSSEAVVIEGGNSVTLINDTVSGNNSTLNGQSTVKTNVLIYQSMSGDAAEGSSSFTMTGGSMTAGTGAMFHVTNVTTEINLSGVDFTYASDSDVFLDASADSWGTAGRNGGNVTLRLDGQDIVGAITADSVSTVAVDMQGGSTWKLTGDSYITSLTGDTSGIDLNGYTLYVNGAAYAA